MNLFDASALLVFLQGEQGANAVEHALEAGGRVGAANWSEVAQKVRASQASWPLARGLLLTYDLMVEPVVEQDAERAALFWERGARLSLADRLCLATGERLAATVWTADRDWGDDGRVRQVR